MRRIALTIRQRIYLILLLTGIGFLGMTIVDLAEMHRSLVERKKAELALIAGIAAAIAEAEHRAAVAGTGEEAAKADAMARIGALRYGDDGYFWISDLDDGRIVMHPFLPASVGFDVLARLGGDPRPFVRRMIATVGRAGQGFVEYRKTRPSDGEPREKLSRVVGFEPWGWIIGTSVYMDDVEAPFWQATRERLGVALGLYALLGAAAVYAARRISRTTLSTATAG